MSTGTIIILLLVGLAAGILSSMVGIGGGLVVIPALVFILGMDQKMAQGTSLAMLLPPIGILGVLVYQKSGNIHWPYALFLIVSFVIGSYLGARWVQNLNTITVKRLFAIFMILIAIKYLFFDKAAPATKKPRSADATDIFQKRQQ